jgi:hypothetical protein
MNGDLTRRPRSIQRSRTCRIEVVRALRVITASVEELFPGYLLPAVVWTTNLLEDPGEANLFPSLRRQRARPTFSPCSGSSIGMGRFDPAHTAKRSRMLSAIEAAIASGTPLGTNASRA